MTPVERVKKMLSMAKVRREKDAAGIYNPNYIDEAVKIKTLKEVLKELNKKGN